jgi:2',3'-cyclic-nucleotide 2'-phosphodiesterase/3'-nucleotidase
MDFDSSMAEELTKRPDTENTATDSPASPFPSPRATFRIISTSDLHMHLNAYDYYADQICADKGLALAAKVIAKARAEIDGSMLVDNGDFLQGSPLGDYVARQGVTPNPMIAAMNQLNYDAVNIGNHEFSHGMGYLSSAIDQAQFTCLSANIFRTKTPTKTSFLPPFSIVQKVVPDDRGVSHVIRIGVIGVLPPQTAVWDQQSIGDTLQIEGMVSSVARTLPKIRAEGADIILALAHCGIGEADARDDAENAALGIAQLDGIDAVVMGHAHLTFPGPAFAKGPKVDATSGTLAGKPAVMPGVYGSHIGIIDLSLERRGGQWRINHHKTEARRVGPDHDQSAGQTVSQTPARRETTEDPAIARLSAAMHQATLDWVRRPIGQIGATIHSYFAAISDSPTVALINRAQQYHIRAQLAGTALADLPVLSASAPYKAGGRGGPGNFSYCEGGDMLLRHAADLCVHPNTIDALRLTGAEILDWLEHSARFFNHIRPDRPDQPLLNPLVPSFQFDTILGLTYQIDLSGAGAERGQPRIVNACYQGQPIAKDRIFILATTNYRSSGSGGFFNGDPRQIVLKGERTSRDILIDYVNSGAAAEARTPPAWRFAALPGVTVTFPTTPLALRHLADVPHLNLLPLFTDAEGFQMMRLAL